MNRAATENHPAKFSVLQLALPSKAPLNIGILLIDSDTGRLYKKLRRDWNSIADPETAEVLDALDDDFSLKNR